MNMIFMLIFQAEFRDGPSAGIAMATGIYSAIYKFLLIIQ